MFTVQACSTKFLHFISKPVEGDKPVVSGLQLLLMLVVEEAAAISLFFTWELPN